MKHKKRGLALLLMLTLALLCGCEGTVSERPMEDISALTIEPGANAPTADTFADQTQTVTLYLLSPNGERLVPVPAEVTMRAGESLAQAALTALLAGAKLERTDASWPMSGEGRAPTLSVSAGIATVNLPAKYRALEPQTLFAVRQAVADTLGSLSGVTSVNVLVGGRGADRLPVYGARGAGQCRRRRADDAACARTDGLYRRNAGNRADGGRRAGD